MELHLFISMLVFLLITAIGPGPNNMLLVSSVTYFGFRRSIPLMLGIIFGIECMTLLIACGVNSLIALYPSTYFVLKIIGSIYLLWLLWKIMYFSDKNKETISTKLQPIYFYQGLLLQFINPNVWLMIIGTITNFSVIGQHYICSIITIILSIGCINTISSIFWLMFGVLFSKLFKNNQSRKIFNIIMSLLIFCSFVLIWNK